MGSTVSHAAAAPPPTATAPAPAPPAGPVGLQQILGLPPEKPAEEEPEKPAKTDWLHLPCPVKYEEIQREAFMSLKPELFEGLRFDFNRGLSPNFSLLHSFYMGSTEVPNQGSVKFPTSMYEFGANFLDQKGYLISRILTDGRLVARVKQDINDNLQLKFQGTLTPEPHFSQVMCDVDFKGADYQAQLKLGNNAFYGFNYIQSVHPTLALGGEAFWLAKRRQSGVGFSARWAHDKAVASAQVATTGIVALTYLHKVSDKLALASDFMYNWESREATASVGYDYMPRHCRLRGRIDTNGTIAAFLEERLNVGLTLILSAEVDHWEKNYKFGFGMTIGE